MDSIHKLDQLLEWKPTHKKAQSQDNHKETVVEYP